MPVDFAANHGVSENTLSTVEHDDSVVPGSVIIFFIIFHSIKQENTEDLVRIINSSGDGDRIWLAGAPIDFFGAVCK